MAENICDGCGNKNITQDLRLITMRGIRAVGLCADCYHRPIIDIARDIFKDLRICWCGIQLLATKTAGRSGVSNKFTRKPIPEGG